jgi:hypothetical protein
VDEAAEPVSSEHGRGGRYLRAAAGPWIGEVGVLKGPGVLVQNDVEKAGPVIRKVAEAFSVECLDCSLPRSRSRRVLGPEYG